MVNGTEPASRKAASSAWCLLFPYLETGAAASVSVWARWGVAGPAAASDETSTQTGRDVPPAQA